MSASFLFLCLFKVVIFLPRAAGFSSLLSVDKNLVMFILYAPVCLTGFSSLLSADLSPLSALTALADLGDITLLHGPDEGEGEEGKDSGDGDGSTDEYGECDEHHQEDAGVEKEEEGPGRLGGQAAAGRSVGGAGDSRGGGPSRLAPRRQPRHRHREPAGLPLPYRYSTGAVHAVRMQCCGRAL